jgi:hypothetical protein
MLLPEVGHQGEAFGERRVAGCRAKEAAPVLRAAFEVVQAVADVCDNPVDVEDGQGHGHESKSSRVPTPCVFSARSTYRAALRT